MNVKPEKAKKKEFKPPPNHFKLQSSVLNDLIVNNDTSKLFKEIIKLTDPFIVTYTG
jgi:retron-type reverse transcriptase